MTIFFLFLVCSVGLPHSYLHSRNLLCFSPAENKIKSCCQVRMLELCCLFWTKTREWMRIRYIKRFPRPPRSDTTMNISTAVPHLKMKSNPTKRPCILRRAPRTHIYDEQLESSQWGEPTTWKNLIIFHEKKNSNVKNCTTRAAREQDSAERWTFLPFRILFCPTRLVIVFTRGGKRKVCARCRTTWASSFSMDFPWIKWAKELGRWWKKQHEKWKYKNCKAAENFRASCALGSWWSFFPRPSKQVVICC